MAWLERLKQGLGRSRDRLSDGLSALVGSGNPCDQAMLDSLEELLIEADLGPTLAAKMIDQLKKTRFNKTVEPDEIKQLFAGMIAETLRPVASTLPQKITPAGQPTIILIVGVNGSGKTTTIGKLAHKLLADGHKVMLAAGDTYRAAAVEQLVIWGERNNIPVIAAQQGHGKDAAAVAFDAVTKAQEQAMDFLIMDTAGRLHNRSDLMEELAKIHRVIAKKQEGAPHHVIQIVDATTGQNALMQVRAFQEITKLSGLIMTKLDGTAKGGVLVALANQSSPPLPVHAIGVGESVEDLNPFNAEAFAENLIR